MKPKENIQKAMADPTGGRIPRGRNDVFSNTITVSSILTTLTDNITSEGNLLIQSEDKMTLQANGPVDDTAIELVSPTGAILCQCNAFNTDAFRVNSNNGGIDLVARGASGGVGTIRLVSINDSIIINPQGTSSEALFIRAVNGGVRLESGNSGIRWDNKAVVTQTTSPTTSVTANANAGRITTVAWTAGVDASHTFTVNNDHVDTSVNISVTLLSYAGTGSPVVSVNSISAGSFDITVTNVNSAAALNASGIIGFLAY